MACRSWRPVLLGACLLASGCSPVGYIVGAIAIGASGGGSSGGRSAPVGELTVSIGPASPSSSQALPNEPVVEVLQVSLEAAVAQVDVNSITFHASGSGDDLAGISGVRLYVDANVNGRYEGGETELGNSPGYTGDEGDVTFSGLTEAIPVSGQVFWLLVYDLAGQPSPGETFCTALSDAADMAATSGGKPAVVQVDSGIQGCVTTVVGALAVAVGPSNPPASGMGQCASGQVFLQVELSAGSEEGLSIDSMTCTASGTGDDAADVAAVSLYVDADGDGTLGGSDVLLGSPTSYTGDDGTATFSGLGRGLSAGLDERWILVYDLVPGVAVGSTFAARLDGNLDVTATGQVSGRTLPVTGAPVGGNDFTVGDPLLLSAIFDDVDDNGLAGPGDTVTVAFDQEVVVQGTPAADAVFALDPPGSFGAGATVAAGASSNEVTVSLLSGSSLQPNGLFGTDLGSSGVNVAAGQTGLANCSSTALAQPIPASVDLVGELNPRITTVGFTDRNINNVMDAGDTIDLGFTTNVTFTTPDPSLAFQLPVLNDSLGVGAQFRGGGTPADVAAVSIEIGSGAVLTLPGTFDPANLIPGSPSGLDVGATAGQIVDAAYLSVSALPYAPAGRDVPPFPAYFWAGRGDDQTDAWFGCSVASGRDVNGDGYSDVVVGAYGHDTGNADAGKAYLYLGGPEGLSATGDWTSSGDDVAGAEYGFSVALAGDVNSDGYADVLVGAPGQGKVFLYLGSGTGLPPTASWTAQQGPSFGRSVASAGDVDGDTFDDVIVGEPLNDSFGQDAGMAYIYKGEAGAVGLEAAPLWTPDSSAGSGLFGWSVASAGDVNGDGYADVIVGAPQIPSGTGRALCYHGGPSGPAAAYDWSYTRGYEYGTAVAPAGDTDNNGYDDVIIGVPKMVGYGSAYVCYGTPVGLSLSNPSIIEGDRQNGSYFGASVAHAGDINADGLADVIIGCPRRGTANAEAGMAYVYYGGTTLGWTSSGDDLTGARFGTSVASTLDINGDGRIELIIGAEGSPGGPTGKVFAFCP